MGVTFEKLVSGVLCLEADLFRLSVSHFTLKHNIVNYWFLDDNVITELSHFTEYSLIFKRIKACIGEYNNIK